MDKSIHVSMLLEMYGKLLTDKQNDIIDLYYNDNLSLSEIADELGITRQGVRKNLIDAENKLFSIEQKLKFLKKRLERAELLNDMLGTTNDEVEKNIQKLIDIDNQN